jgi:peptide chain release factor 1
VAFDQWEKVQQRYDELSEKIAGTTLDQRSRQKYQKQHSYLTTLLAMRREVVAVEASIEETEQARQQAVDKEMLQLCLEELEALQKQKNDLLLQIDDYLFPPDELNAHSAFVELRAGAGGQEAALFAADLLRAYAAYALKRGWRFSIVSESETDLKGYKEVIAHVEGKGVYGVLKRESGVHRVQRVPQTETQGRVHTSTITVAVLPELDDEVNLTINPSDLRIDTYRAGGAGGQHVNRTDSAVRLTHIPTGLVVACQDERSQHKNKAKAMKILQSRIVAAQEERKQAELSQQRRDLVGSGMRAEKVRTYNYPQNRVTDHQVEMTLNKLDLIMEGDFDELLEALQKKEAEDKKKQPLTFLSE